MRNVRLRTVSDCLDAAPGLIVVGTPAFDTLYADREGGLIAHDLIEHQNGVRNIGPAWDELEAIGAIWHTRGRHGDIREPHQSLASDVYSAYSSWDGERRVRSTRPHDHDEDFREILYHAHKSLRYEDIDPADYLDFALDHLRIGFRKANRRFGSGYRSNEMYRAIKAAVARCLRWIDFEGQEFTLTYGNGHATVKPRP